MLVEKNALKQLDRLSVAMGNFVMWYKFTLREFALNVSWSTKRLEFT